jgi:hypothetical protein
MYLVFWLNNQKAINSENDVQIISSNNYIGKNRNRKTFVKSGNERNCVSTIFYSFIFISILQLHITPHKTTQYNTAQHNTVQHNTAQQIDSGLMLY